MRAKTKRDKFALDFIETRRVPYILTVAMRLSDLKPGQSGVITKILGHGAFRKRVMEMGFVKGRVIHVLLDAPLQDPIKYSLMGYEVSLRRAEADLIEVVSEGAPEPEKSNKPDEAPAIKKLSGKISSHGKVSPDKVINVALIGNPNCGKTSLFNMVAGAHEHVGNYAGVTVDSKEGSLYYRGYRINIVDLPGTYSLSAYSPEEKFVLNYLKESTPDVIVNVVVSSNLERNLYLTTELIDMNRSMVIALNMYDELQKKNIKLDYQTLGKLLGVPVVPTVASTGWGVEQLLDVIIEVFELKNPDMRHIHVVMRPELEEAISALNDSIKQDKGISQQFSPRYLAIKMYERDPEVEKMLSSSPYYDEWVKIRDNYAEDLRRKLDEDIGSLISAEKYGFIEGALAETMEGDIKRESQATKIIDAFVTNKLFGFPIFLLLMWLTFWATFEIGAYPMEWIEKGISLLSGYIGEYMPDGPFKDLLLDGVIGGVGGVIVFLPNILILYTFISFMEDSGYMARAAFIMDKLMHKMGLHGKSFIPLVMGFGCNVPSIISTRIIESNSSRLITILVNPFISCSARIPIYVLLVGAFFPNHGAWVYVGLYLLGILVAIFTARLLRKFWFKEDETPFVMELPPYRIPTAKATIRNMWSKAKQYLNKMGGVILVASVIIWIISYFPRFEYDQVPQEYKDRVASELPAATSYSGDLGNTEKEKDLILTEYQQENSILGHIGKFCQPVLQPMDFDWKATVALLAGLSAKEVVVSTMGVLYTGDGDDSELLSERLKTPSPVSGIPPFNPVKAMAFMVFVLIYVPCIATLVAIVKETGSWKYGLFSLLYNTALAWALSFAVYRIGLLL